LPAPEGAEIIKSLPVTDFTIRIKSLRIM